MPSLPLARPSVTRMAPPVSRPANPSRDLLPRDQPATGLAARSSAQGLRIDPERYGQETSGEPPFLRHSPEGPGTGPTVRYCNTNAWHSSPAGSSVCEGSVSLSGSTTISPTRARSTAAAVATIEVHLPPTVRQSPLLVSCRHCSGSPEPQLMPVGWQSPTAAAAAAAAETSRYVGDPPLHPSPPLQSPPLRPRASAVWGASPEQHRSPQNSPPNPPSPVQPRAPQSSPQSSPEPAARSPQTSPHSSQSPVQPPPAPTPAHGQSPAQTAGGGSCAAACAAGLGEDSHAPPRTRAAADAQDWDAQQVAAFVSSLGAPLCQHAAAFLANGVTGARLGVLRADELPQLGVRRFEDILALLSHIRDRLELPPPPPREPMRCTVASALHLPPPPPPPPPPQPHPLSLPPRKARFDEQRYRELHEQIAREADLLSRSPPKMSLHQLKTIQPLLQQGGGELGSQTVACLLQRLRCENSTKEL